MTTARWKQCPIDVDSLGSPYGIECVSGYVHPEVMGLAVTPEIGGPGRFVITHVPSKRKLPAAWSSVGAAKRALRRVGKIGEWARDGAVIVADEAFVDAARNVLATTGCEWVP